MVANSEVTPFWSYFLVAGNPPGTPKVRSSADLFTLLTSLIGAAKFEWNTNMYRIDMSKPDAQAYCDSIVARYASWGLDFVKADDMTRPYHEAEIDACPQGYHPLRPAHCSESLSRPCAPRQGRKLKGERSDVENRRSSLGRLELAQEHGRAH